MITAKNYSVDYLCILFVIHFTRQCVHDIVHTRLTILLRCRAFYCGYSLCAIYCRLKLYTVLLYTTFNMRCELLLAFS